jgi:hypothetical protein
MSNETMQDITLEDHKNAFNEVAFLMDIFTSTIDNIMGGATAPVGRIAGRDMARKLPVYLNNPSLEEAIEILSSRMKAGFEFSVEAGEEKKVVFDRCALRDVCSLRKIDTGGAMCRLFHAYFDGIVNELISRPVKSEIISSGKQCITRIRTQ